MVRIGGFIDSAIESHRHTGSLEDDGHAEKLRAERLGDGALGDVMCFGVDDHAIRFRPINAVIRHPLQEKLFRVKTAYGRSVRVTSSHSVFTHENGAIRLKRGDELRTGDRLVAPQRLSLPERGPGRIDVLRVLWQERRPGLNAWLRGPAVEEWFRERVRRRHADNQQLTAERVEIPRDVGDALAAKRRASGLTNRELCATLGLKQSVTLHAWEQGKSRPTQSQFDAYLRAVGADADVAQALVQVVPSRLERTWQTQYSGSGRNAVRTLVHIDDLEKEDVEWFAARDDFKLTPEHYADATVPRHLEVDADLLSLLGFYLAEGSCSDRNGIRLSIGRGNSDIAPEMATRLQAVFGLHPTLYETAGRAAELKLVNRVAAAAWQAAFGFRDAESHTKRIPDLVFNVPPSLRVAFLRGYFRGDGTAAAGRVGFATSSYDLASGLLYLLSSLGVVASLSEHEPDGQVRMIRGEPCVTRHRHWQITVSAAEDLRRLEAVWTDHPAAEGIRAHVERVGATNHRRFDTIDGDLMALPVVAIEEVTPSNGYVYDFSVASDENFVAGMGGICCHNTDADVDGSHIRTLLLTFFYRQIPELIERGHVYIAQPPLYKVKKGKTENYVKDDVELNNILLRTALEEAQLYVAASAEAMPPSALETLARKYMDFQNAVRRSPRRYDSHVLDQMLHLPELSATEREDTARLIAWGKQLESLLNATLSAGRTYTVTLHEGTPPHLVVTRIEHGLTVEKHLHKEFFNSSEYRRITDLSRTLAGLFGPGAYVQRGEAKQDVATFKEAIAWLLEQARKGQSIQRYKGLGEMNPEQLWDTTINPETRRLVQVRIEDALGADQIFSTLMGDQVEPRREFIERNALLVSNLDV
jgi:DNA gyrase subunit B